MQGLARLKVMHGFHTHIWGYSSKLEKKGQKYFDLVIIRGPALLKVYGDELSFIKRAFRYLKEEGRMFISIHEAGMLHVLKCIREILADELGISSKPPVRTGRGADYYWPEDKYVLVTTGTKLD